MAGVAGVIPAKKGCKSDYDPHKHAEIDANNTECKNTECAVQ